MSCRFIIAMVAALACACAADSDQIEQPEDFDMSGKGLAPWHMWGSSQVIKAPSASNMGIAQPYTNAQLLRINYKRPETWNFFFEAKPIQLTGPDTNGILLVYFDVTFGVGRSSTTVEGFEIFEWRWVDWNNYGAHDPKYSTAVYGPDRRPINSIRYIPPNEISKLVAQDIQVSVRVFYYNSIVPFTGDIQMEITSFWSPASHVRPDWFQGKFTGSEDGGT